MKTQAEESYLSGNQFFLQNKLDEAIEKYQAAIKTDVNFLPAYYNLGLAYSKQNKFSEAIATYQTLLSKSPSHLATNFQLGILHLQVKEIDKALQHFLLAEQLAPTHFETQFNLGNVYLELKNIAKAKEYYLRALEKQPDDTQILFNLGVIAAQQGELDKAIQHYQTAVRYNSDFFAAHNNLGVAFLTKQHIPFALQHFKEALRIQPNNAAIEFTVRMLSQDQRLLTSPPEYITNLFDAYADHYDEHLLHSLEYKVPVLLKEAINQYRPLQKNTYNILDLGCGTGLCGEVFKPYAKKFIGVDLSPNMLAQAKEKNIYDELVCEELATFLQDKKFAYDMIIAGDVLVYLGDLTTLFANISAALKPDGLFAFNTEISASDDFSVTQSGRFVHAKNYIEKLAKQFNFKVVSYQQIITRQQYNEPVSGHLFVLEK